MNKYQNSLDRIALNFGFDCLDGKVDKALAEDISNMQELVDLADESRLRIEKLERALDKACEELEKGWCGKYWGNEKTFWDKKQWRRWCIFGDE